MGTRIQKSGQPLPRLNPKYKDFSDDEMDSYIVPAAFAEGTDEAYQKEVSDELTARRLLREAQQRVQSQQPQKASPPRERSYKEAAGDVLSSLVPNSGTIPALGRGIYQGALFDFGDEIGAGLAGVPDFLKELATRSAVGMRPDENAANIYEAMKSDAPRHAMQEELKDLRELNARSRDENPAAYLGGELLGSLAGTGAIKGLWRAGKAGKATYQGAKALSALKMLQAEEAARKALPLLKRLGLGALEGSGFGALYGLGNSEGTPVKSTALGALGGAIGGTVGEALSGPLSKLTGGTRQQNLLKSLGASDEAIEKMAKGDYKNLSDYLTKSQEANAVAQEQAKKTLSEEAAKKTALRGPPSDYPEFVRMNVEPEFAQEMNKATDEATKKLLDAQPTLPTVNDLKLRLLKPEELSSVVSGKNPAAAAAVTPTKERIQRYVTDLANDVETLQVPAEGGTKKAFPLSLFRSPEATAELAAQANEALKGAAPRESQVAETVHQLAKGYTGNRTPGPFARFMQKLTKDLPVASGLTELASTEAFPRSNAAAYLAKTFSPPLSYPVGIAGAEQAQSLVPTGLEMLQNYFNTPRALSPEETQRLEDERKEKSKKSFIQQQTDAGSQYGEP